MNSIIQFDLNFFTITVFAGVLIWLSDGQKEPRWLLFISATIMVINTSALPWHFIAVVDSDYQPLYYVGILASLVIYVVFFVDGLDSFVDYKKEKVANEGVRLAYRRLTNDQKESFKSFVNGKTQ